MVELSEKQKESLIPENSLSTDGILIINGVVIMNGSKKFKNRRTGEIVEALRWFSDTPRKVVEDFVARNYLTWMNQSLAVYCDVLGVEMRADYGDFIIKHSFKPALGPGDSGTTFSAICPGPFALTYEAVKLEPEAPTLEVINGIKELRIGDVINRRSGSADEYVVTARHAAHVTAVRSLFLHTDTLITNWRVLRRDDGIS